MKPNGGQGRAESEKWTGTNPNDYCSNGCIKLNPTNVKALFAEAGSLGRSRVKGPVVASQGLSRRGARSTTASDSGPPHHPAPAPEPSRP
ncbi:hypothetical protein [Streptomyces uncialis]|uniref:hypothetical protein n=1 Tax=Streptomyces uncialis TaxID=1048205 RepID=UPI0033E244AD